MWNIKESFFGDMYTTNYFSLNAWCILRMNFLERNTWKTNTREKNSRFVYLLFDVRTTIFFTVLFFWDIMTLDLRGFLDFLNFKGHSSNLAYDFMKIVSSL